MILLDTNVIVGILRGNEKIANRFARHLGDVAIPAMSLGELYFGVAKSRNPAKNRELLVTLLAALPVMHTSDAIMEKFGELKALLSKHVESVEDADTLIAATALAYDATLVTGNFRHFSRFDGLKLDDWSR
ncbi:MAG: type II toxin-antitoxin system VapC family toxin [Kiritimatiellae bacterium]|nr:type II toxin-antitoxin system VapC family toxin [Kiritimatiellia bacterium]